MNDPLHLIKLIFTSPERTYLEERGWSYLGSQTGYIESTEAKVAIHYYEKDGNAKTTKAAVRAQVTMDNGDWKKTYLPGGFPPDIAGLDVSDGRKLQLVWQRSGLCIRCGKLRYPKSKAFCLRHLVWKREKERKRHGFMARHNSMSYKAEEEVFGRSEFTPNDSDKTADKQDQS